MPRGPQFCNMEHEEKPVGDDEFDRLVRDIEVEKSKSKSKPIINYTDDEDDDYVSPEDLRPKRAAAMKAKAINKEIGNMSNSKCEKRVPKCCTCL